VRLLSATAIRLCQIDGINQRGIDYDNNTVIDGSDASGGDSGEEGNRIALGEGIGIGVLTFVFTVFTVIAVTIAMREGWCCFRR
jgi:hypothetical protein